MSGCGVIMSEDGVLSLVLLLLVMLIRGDCGLQASRRFWYVGSVDWAAE